MSGWTYCCTGQEFYATEMDREFLLDLRECKILLDKEKEHKQYIFILLFLKYPIVCFKKYLTDFQPRLHETQTENTREILPRIRIKFQVFLTQF